jgi:hypothetical protein
LEQLVLQALLVDKAVLVPQGLLVSKEYRVYRVPQEALEQRGLLEVKVFKEPLVLQG